MKGTHRALARGFWWRRGALALVLGVVTTVTVAWGLAAWMPLSNGTLREGVRGARDEEGKGTIFEWLLLNEVNTFGATRRAWRIEVIHALYGPFDTLRWEVKGEHSNERRWPITWGALSGVGDTYAMEAGLPTAGIEDARGWPWRSFWCSIHQRGPGRFTVDGGREISNQPTSATPLTLRVLPLRPIWWGLAADAAMCDALWLFVLIGVPLLRRHHRLVRGRCSACGYDLAGELGGGCPECGWGRERGERDAVARSE